MTEHEMELFTHFRILRAERDRYTEMAAECANKMKILLGVIDGLTRKIEDHPARKMETGEICDLDELRRF